MAADSLGTLRENLQTALNSLNTRERDISTDLAHLQEKTTVEIEAIQTHIEQTTTAQLLQAQQNIDSFTNDMGLKLSSMEHQLKEMVKIRDLLQALARSTIATTDAKLLDLSKLYKPLRAI
ncbi:hypothetical protein [Helicobacter heilmannii]|uniref:hypothetical protein n=1 Tax=Helicobacter heilmannii TaxID=35817 RepID=UPI0006B39878|nr:hypothetical protein [Helicobacter heilmannii]